MKYLVFMQDEYLNNYYIGLYKELKNAIPEINKWLSIYNTKIEELTEYTSTYNNCFDKEIETEDGIYVYVRGFILNDKDLTCLD